MLSLQRICLIPLALLALVVVAVLVSLASYSSPGQQMQALLSAETLYAVRLTLITSSAATVLALLLGVPAAYFLARRDFPGKQVLDTILDLPLVMPPLVAGVGLLLLLGNTTLGEALAAVGLRFIFTPAGAVLAQTFVAAFIVLRGAKAAFEAVGPDYEAAAQTLGLKPLQVFRRVTLPMAARGLLSAGVLAWARAMGEFGATLMVAGATQFKTETLPLAVFLNLSSGEPEIAVACAMILLVLGFTLLAALRWIMGRTLEPSQEKDGRVCLP